jgi:hypothetical protein
VGFGDDRYLCLSVEARKEVGERYSVLLSFFCRFELIYVIGDERDLVRLRTAASRVRRLKAGRGAQRGPND